MKRNLLKTACCSLLFFVLGSLSTNAQTWYQATVLTGSQVLGTTTVTVVGTGGNFGYYNFCNLMPGPYLPGNTSPGNFHFTFSTPVMALRFITHGMGNLEVNSIEINGAPYALGPANNLIVCPTCTGTCQDPIGSFVGGNLVGIPGSGGQFTIENVPGGISTVRFSNNGQQAGTGFSLEFQEGMPVVATNNGPVCWGDTLKLFGQPTLPAGSYLWTGPNGYSSTQQNPIIPSPNQSHEGNYILTVNGAYTDTTEVVLLPRPSNPVVSFPQPICQGKSVQLSATTSPMGASYTWWGPDGYSSTTFSPTLSNIQTSQSGQYGIQAEINGCKSDSIFFNLNVKMPTSSEKSVTICEGETYFFNGQPLTANGTYVDTFLNSAGCDSIAKLKLTVRQPLAMNLEINSEKAFCIGDTVTITASGAESYVWNFKNMDLFLGDGTTKQVKLIAPKNKYFVVGTDMNNCKGQKEIEIPAEPCCDIMIPNAFSPNNDGRNDKFGVQYSGHFREFELRIFDRLGQIVFVSFNPANHWDGTINEKQANTGVYHYLIKAKCDYGPDILETGDITLIR